MNGGEVIVIGLRGSVLLFFEYGISFYFIGIVYLCLFELFESMGVVLFDG